MTAALHNCSNKDDSGVGSRGSAKWNKQMAREEKVKGKYSLRVSIQSTNTLLLLFFHPR